MRIFLRLLIIFTGLVVWSVIKRQLNGGVIEAGIIGAVTLWAANAVNLQARSKKTQAESTPADNDAETGLLDSESVVSSKPLPGYNYKKCGEVMKEYPGASALVDFVGGYQRLILIVVIAVLIVMLVYPPFQVIGKNGTVFNMGYDWIFDPPKQGIIVATVNVPMLLIQWVGILVVGGLVFLP